MSENIKQFLEADALPKYDLGQMEAFLCGEASIDSLWYGDRHPTEKGAFWWRKHLRAAIEAEENKRAALLAAFEQVCCASTRLNEALSNTQEAYNIHALRTNLSAALTAAAPYRKLTENV